MDRSAYWSVIAQVAPVIGLALVLEVRGFARRSARNAPDTRGPWTRAWFVILAFLSACCLIWVFVTAIWALARNNPMEGADGFILLSLSVAFGFVAFNPITPIFGVLAADVYSHAAGVTRQFVSQRLTRTLDRQVARVERGMRAIRVERLTEYADMYAKAHAALRTATASGDTRRVAIASGYIRELEEWREANRTKEAERTAAFQCDVEDIREMIAKEYAMPGNRERIIEALEALGD